MTRLREGTAKKAARRSQGGAQSLNRGHRVPTGAKALGEQRVKKGEAGEREGEVGTHCPQGTGGTTAETD